jgi:4-amino-4-deoxy-L-arabinose transferase-like glycosyltransferase
VSATRQHRRATALPLLLLLLGGTALRLYRLEANSLWVDEFATLRIASLPLSRILAENVGNSSFEPPLFFWLMHAIVRAFGASELAMRLPSAIAGLLTIPAVWWLVRELGGERRLALLSAALVALNPLHLWYSQEARPYALLMLFATLAAACLARGFRRSTRGAWVGFAGWTLLAVFTHLTGLLLLGVAWAWAAVHAGRRRLMVPLFASSMVVMAFIAPLLFAIARVDRTGNGSPARAGSVFDIPYTLFTYVGGYSFGPSVREIQNWGPWAAIIRHPVDTSVGTATLAVLLTLILRARRNLPPGLVLMFVMYVSLTVLASAITGKAYNVRYTLPGLIGFLGLAAVALRRMDAPLSAAGVVLVLGVFAWADAQWLVSPTYGKDDSRALVRWLADRLPSDAVVVAAPGYVVGVLSHYVVREQARLQFTPQDSVADSIRPAALVLTRLHHVADVQSLREWFRRRSGSPTRESDVGGYLVVLPQNSSATAR